MSRELKLALEYSSFLPYNSTIPVLRRAGESGYDVARFGGDCIDKLKALETRTVGESLAIKTVNHKGYAHFAAVANGRYFLDPYLFHTDPIDLIDLPSSGTFRDFDTFFSDMRLRVKRQGPLVTVETVNHARLVPVRVQSYIYTFEQLLSDTSVPLVLPRGEPTHILKAYFPVEDGSAFFINFDRQNKLLRVSRQNDIREEPPEKWEVECFAAFARQHGATREEIERAFVKADAILSKRQVR